MGDGSNEMSRDCAAVCACGRSSWSRCTFILGPQSALGGGSNVWRLRTGTTAVYVAAGEARTSLVGLAGRAAGAEREQFVTIKIRKLPDLTFSLQGLRVFAKRNPIRLGLLV